MIMSELTPLVSARYGVFFLMDSEGDTPIVKFANTYAYRERKGLANRFRLGDSLVGQCALDRKCILVGNVKEEFLAVVSHELRNPLNAIKGWTHLLRSGKLDGSKNAKALEAIERNVDLQAALIEDLVDVSRIVRGELNLKVSVIRLAPVIEAALAAVRPAAYAGEALTLLTEAAPDLMISDIAMPEIDGYELICRVRERVPATRMPPSR